MITLFSILCFGFFLGIRHAMDADHVIAISTIVSRERNIRDASRIGLVWGIGHTLTVGLVGGAIVLFGLVLPPKLGLSLEFTVALMLIGLGLWNLKGFTRWVGSTFDSIDNDGLNHCHSHPHTHGDYIHNHPHGHEPERHGHREDQTPPARLDRWFGKLRFYQILRPLIIGMVHGMAGSAALALLVLPIVQTPAWAIGYLLVFGAGTILGMMLITAALAWPMSRLADLPRSYHRRVGAAAGCLSLCFGLFLVWRIGFLEGLFFG